MRNRERDAEKQKQLQELGWNIIVIWECELKPSKEERLVALTQEITGDKV